MYCVLHTALDSSMLYGCYSSFRVLGLIKLVASFKKKKTIKWYMDDVIVGQNASLHRTGSQGKTVLRSLLMVRSVANGNS